MSRFIWLVFERVPHPGAVSYPAGAMDVGLVLELLSRPYPERIRLAEQLGNFLKRQNTLPVFRRESVPCRRQSGLYHLIPWRMAKWLAKVLPARDSVVENTHRRLSNWLENSDRPDVVCPTAVTK